MTAPEVRGDQDRAILALRRGRYSIHRIASDLRLTSSTVRRRLAALGETTDLRRYAGHRRQRIKAAMDRGDSAYRIAQTEGCCVATVRWHMAMIEGHPIRRPVPGQPPVIARWRCDCDPWQVQTGTTCALCQQAPPWGGRAA